MKVECPTAGCAFVGRTVTHTLDHLFVGHHMGVEAAYHAVIPKLDELLDRIAIAKDNSKAARLAERKRKSGSYIRCANCGYTAGPFPPDAARTRALAHAYEVNGPHRAVVEVVA